MKELLTKPIKLYNTIQHYEWGTINEEAFITDLLGIMPEKDKPYAELWIGAHQKSPSLFEYNGRLIDLNFLIDEFPEEILGYKVAEMFNNKLPFLLKVLSARKALSIQTHPNKEQARQLHKESPENYPDENHKPEIAVALDRLYALVGIKPVSEIKKVFESFTFLSDYFLPKTLSEMFQSEDVDKERLVKNFMSELLQIEKSGKISEVLKLIEESLTARQHLSIDEELFLKNKKQFLDDVGLLAFLFFNFVSVDEGEGFYTDAGIPHAYLQGNIVECMANSDNVVRAGLTPKFKDVKTLLNILRYSNDQPTVIPSNSSVHRYITDAKEFELIRFSLQADDRINYPVNNRICVFIIIEGEIELEIDFDGNKYQFHKGESFMIPAINKNLLCLSLSSATLFMATVP
ncbi:MAG: mannose-6-phosphate isomerase, class I [Bacteroidetes bacterium]|nr:mannose-6-phosphate isomerase, class I [Bacteroidota bacterium]